MNSIRIDERPIVAIGLDIDGVINNPNTSEDLIFELLPKLFPEHKGMWKNSMCDIAATHFFDQKALRNLDFLINKISEFAQPIIIITSSWRKGKNVEQLIKLFESHNFSKYIAGATPDSLGEKDSGKYCDHTNINSSRNCRAAEIQYYWNNHPEITKLLVLDDIDEHLTHSFGEYFIQTNIRELLTMDLALKALNILA